MWGCVNVEGCKTRYLEMYNQELPADYNEQYDQFMYHCSRDVASQISALVDSLRPGCMMVTYMTEHVDATSSESDTYIWHETPAVALQRQRQCEPGAEYQSPQNGPELCHALCGHALAVCCHLTSLYSEKFVSVHGPWGLSCLRGTGHL